MPKNNLYCVCSKDDVNTPSAIYFPQDDNQVSAMFCAKGDSHISAIAHLGFLPHTWVVFLQVLAIESSR